MEKKTFIFIWLPKYSERQLELITSWQKRKNKKKKKLFQFSLGMLSSHVITTSFCCHRKSSICTQKTPLPPTDWWIMRSKKKRICERVLMVETCILHIATKKASSKTKLFFSSQYENDFWKLFFSFLPFSTSA